MNTNNKSRLLTIFLFLIITSLGYSQRTVTFEGYEILVKPETVFKVDQYFKMETKKNSLLLIFRTDGKLIVFERKDFSYNEYDYKIFPGVMVAKSAPLDYLEIYKEGETTNPKPWIMGHKETGKSLLMMGNGEFTEVDRSTFEEIHKMVGSVNLHLIRTKQEKPNLWTALYGDLKITDLTKIALEEIEEGIQRGGGVKVSDTRVIKGRDSWVTVQSPSTCYSGSYGESFIKETVMTVLDRKDTNSDYTINSKWLVRHKKECTGETYTVYKDGTYYKEYPNYNEAYSAIAYTAY